MKPIKFGTRALATVFTLALAAAILSSPAPRAEGGKVSPAAERLGRAVQFQTISYQDRSQLEVEEFRGFHRFLEGAYPLIHSRLERELINDMSLLYTWEGADPSLPALIYTAHIDVVPIEPGTAGDWTHPPFSGRIADGFVWGRGTLDCKGSLIGLMEAVESLLSEGYVPRRTIYLAFGHDEEVGGDTGALAIASLLRERGVRAEYVLDEGGFIIDGTPLGVSREIALIGIAEKGYLSLELKVRTEGGHSSMPPDHTAIGILAAAITQLENNPFPPRLEGVALSTFQSLAPALPSALRAAVRAHRLLNPLIIRELSRNQATNAVIRTTTAATIIEAGSKENVLPQEARAVVNFRLLPGDSIEFVVNRVKKIIDDPRVEVSIIGTPREASLVTSTDSLGYQTLTGVIREMFPQVAPAPYLVLGGTDARHYELVSDSIMRFVPHRLDETDQARIHGTNERLSLENLDKSVEFYSRLIKALD